MIPPSDAATADAATAHPPADGRTAVPAGAVRTQPEFRDEFLASKSRDVFFILGVQGSGTNLTAQLLRSVFGFSTVLDGSLIFRSAVRVHARPRREVVVREFRRVHRHLFPGPVRRRFTLRHYHHRNAGFRGIEEHFDPALIESGSDFARFFYTYHAWRIGTDRQAVKSDDLWQLLDHLGPMFPNRKLIHLVRDPRDNALSVTRKNFGPRDLFVAAKFVARQLDAYRREAARQPEGCVTVTYESLLAEPWVFITEFSERFGFSVPPDAAQAVDSLGIRQDNSRKWERLPKRDLTACEAVLERDLRDFGYGLSQPQVRAVGRAEAAGRHLRDWALRVPQKAEHAIQDFLRG
ncbi:MAG TPA: sulfotransferase [Planctomycetaceae bacterium]